MMIFTLPYPPTSNNFKMIVRNRMILTGEARRYKVAAGQCAIAAGVSPVDYPVSVYLDVFRPRRAGDLDNTLKVLLDSLTGIAYTDDSQIVEIHARRYDDAKNPRVEVSVTKSDIPIELSKAKQRAKDREALFTEPAA